MINITKHYQPWFIEHINIHKNRSFAKTRFLITEPIFFLNLEKTEVSEKDLQNVRVLKL
jgi:hypothetical protein